MNTLTDLLERNRSGAACALPCFCTANAQVLEAIMDYAARRTLPVVIEATCNQVNQEGGYTGLGAADYARWISRLADEHGVAADSVILGGDHLGPNPWRHLPASEAMQQAAVLVRDYAAAGYRKLHLDASMACAGEPTPSFDTVAERAASLCQIAEQHSPDAESLVYIIGTEVPVPGGETDDTQPLTVTTAQRLQQTIDTHRRAFEHKGLGKAWQRIASVVVQPGVDFSHTSVHRFEPAQAAELSTAIREQDGLTFEAHSTDYQPDSSLAELVASHCFFLKVGPELTFRMREAVFALARIEQLLQTGEASNLIRIIDQAMSDDPSSWQDYYQGTDDAIRQLRHYSYSDRIRYYWNVPQVSSALRKLMANLERRQIPETVASQFFPAAEFDRRSTAPAELIRAQVQLSVRRYYRACGFGPGKSHAG